MNIQINIKYRVLFTFFLLLVFQALLYFRYKALGIQANLIAFEIVLLAGALLVSFSIQKWNDFVNPVSLYYLFIFGFGYSTLGLSRYSQSLDTVSIVIIILTIISFISGAFLNVKVKSLFYEFRFTNRSNLLIYYTLVLVSLLSFVYELINIGYIPVIKMFSFDVYNDTNKKLVSFIHYFAMLFAIMPSWTYILYKRNILGKKWLVFVVLLSIFVILNYLSRQTILLFLLTIFVTYTFYNKLNYKRIASYGIGIILIFFIIGQIRLAQMDSVKADKDYSTIQFLRNLAGMEYETNLVETTFTLYSSVRYSKLDEIVEKSIIDEYTGKGKYVFRPLVSLTLLDRIGIVKYERKYDVESILATYAIDPYLDFGFLGVVIVGLFYGLISMHFYRNFKQGDERYIISWSIIIFCIIMAPFMNYFSSFFIFLIWIINKLVV